MLNPEHKKTEEVQESVPEPAVVEEKKIAPTISDKPALLQEVDEVAEGYDDAQERRNLVVFGVGLLILIILVVLVGLVYWYGVYLQTSSQDIQSESSVTESVQESVPTAAKLSVLDKGDVAFVVLNASGVSGLASTYASRIEDLGYDKVEAGNSSRANVTVVTYKIVDGVDAQNLKNDVAKVLAGVDYEEKSEVGKGGNSVEIILGLDAK